MKFCPQFRAAFLFEILIVDFIWICWIGKKLQCFKVSKNQQDTLYIKVVWNNLFNLHFLFTVKIRSRINYHLKQNIKGQSVIITMVISKNSRWEQKDKSTNWKREIVCITKPLKEITLYNFSSFHNIYYEHIWQ